MSAEIIVAEHMRSLGLSGSLDEFRRHMNEPASASLGFDERLAMILGAQVDLRANRRVSRRIREAELKISAPPAEIDYSVDRGTSRAQMAEVLSLGFMKRHHNILVTGPTGTGSQCAPSLFLCCK